MSLKRTLVECAVLSLQDACVFYPCCEGCFSRVDVEQQDTTRCRCSKCGYSCLREQVDYRYRLSMRVARDGCIFGVTVFGTCLNPFFGIHASGLQRLVENLDGPVGASTRSTLLLKAVEDCFIGRHFIFGIKVNETESGHWFGGPAANVSSRKDTAHFIASQMILPKATGLRGCTVVSYYRVLLQKAAEYELGSTDASKTFRPPATTLLLIPRNSPASSFNNGTLLSQSLQRSQYHDDSLNPTPPWQQSLGLVTSSAEQEEGCSTQDSGDKSSTQADGFRTPHHAQRGRPYDSKVTEETERSPRLSLARSSYSSPSFAKYPRFSIEKTLGNTPTQNTWFSPSPLGRNSSKRKGFTTRELTETVLPSSLAWEDLPFSESLTEFLCEENKDFDIVSETEPHRNVQNQKETPRSNLENISRQDKNLSIESTSVCYRSTRITHGYTGILLDITNAPAQNGGDRRDLSDQVSKTPTGCVNKHECDHEDEEEEEDTYDCSADLFSSSLMIDMSTSTLNTNTDTVGATADKRHLRSEKADVSHSTPDKQKLKSNKCINGDSFIPPGTQDLDFIPPSQSTPIVEVSGSPVSSYRSLTLGDFSSQPDSRDSSAFHRNLSGLEKNQAAKSNSSLHRLNCVGANRLCQDGRESAKENLVRSTTSNRCSHGLTPKRRFWKPDKYKNSVLAQQHLGVQRGALNTGRTNHKCDSCECDVTVCDYEDGEATILPPTPAAKTRPSVNLRGRRRRRQTNNSSSTVGSTWEGQQGDGVALDHTLTSSQRGQTQTGNCDSETVYEASVDGSNCFLLGDENGACDWSRDLFSDSV